MSIVCKLLDGYSPSSLVVAFLAVVAAAWPLTSAVWHISATATAVPSSSVKRAARRPPPPDLRGAERQPSRLSRCALLW